MGGSIKGGRFGRILLKRGHSNEEKINAFKIKLVYETPDKWIQLPVYPTQPCALAGCLSAAFNGDDFQNKTAHNVMKIGDLSCALIKIRNAENLKKQRIAWTSFI